MGVGFFLPAGRTKAKTAPLGAANRLAGVA